MPSQIIIINIKKTNLFELDHFLRFFFPTKSDVMVVIL